MSSIVHTDNKGKDIFVLGKESTQGSEGSESTLTAEQMYSINFTVIKKKFWITMEQIVICLLMVLKFTNLKQNILKL